MENDQQNSDADATNRDAANKDFTTYAASSVHSNDADSARVGEPHGELGADSSVEADPASPTIEVLSPQDAAILDPTMGPNVSLNRTSVSIGFGGVSVERTSLATEAATSAEAGEHEPLVDTTGYLAPNASEEPLFDDIRLLSRLVVGLALAGSEELLARIRTIEEEIEDDPTFAVDDTPLLDLTNQQAMQYLLIGATLWGQRQALHGVYRTTRFSMNTAGLAVHVADRATSRFPLRPLRRSFDSVLTRVGRGVRMRIEEGRIESEVGKQLAVRTVLEVIDEFIDHLSENPELADLVGDQINAQSMSIASNVVDGSRKISQSADSIVERVTRRLFKMRDREELPESPHIGEPQTMYEPEAIVEAADRAASKVTRKGISSDESPDAAAS